MLPILCLMIHTMPNNPLPPPIPLDKPGAGVPWLERAYLRYYMKPFVAARSDWDKNWENFDYINTRLFEKIHGLTPAQLEQQILVPRLSGLENSSRYWSIAMTLEHLIIVGEKQKTLITALSQGITPPGRGDTATVKPKGGKPGDQQLAEYRAFIATLRPTLDPLKAAALKSRTRFPHPWMDKINARQWQWLYPAHTHVHYQQIKEIVKGL